MRMMERSSTYNLVNTATAPKQNSSYVPGKATL